jgi:type I restriction enzyme S subunit
MLRADLSYLPFLRRKDAESPKLSHLKIQPGMTLISCSGTIGRMVFTRSDMSEIYSSQHIMKVMPDVAKISAGFLYAFLSSKHGVPMVTSGTYGSIIQSIEPGHIANLHVPRMGSKEDEIEAIMNESTANVIRYQELVCLATDKFFASVGLKDITTSEWNLSGPDIGFQVNVGNSNSLRALNFNPRYEALKETLQSVPWKPLAKICESGTLTRGGRFKRIDAGPEYSRRLIGQKHLFWLQPEGRWIARTALDTDVLVEPGTVLIAARGTLGEHELYSRAEFAWGPGVELAYSEDILRARADESIMPRGCLFAFLRSETAFRMLRSISVGSKLQDHHHIFRALIPVPYPPMKVQQEIHSLVVEAYECRHRGVALENQARSLVEKAIEENS